MKPRRLPFNTPNSTTTTSRMSRTLKDISIHRLRSITLIQEPKTDKRKSLRSVPAFSNRRNLCNLWMSNEHDNNETKEETHHSVGRLAGCKGADLGASVSARAGHAADDGQSASGTGAARKLEVSD